MISIKLVNYDNQDFIQLCNLLEKEHLEVIKEQRSPNGNCLNNLDKFKIVFVAYDDLKPVGCLAMKDKIDDVIEVGRLYVLPEYRKNGIASMLFNNVFDKANDLKAKKIILDTYKRFESAVRLYKKLGFYEINNYIADSPYSVCMEKIIEGSDPNE